MSLNLFFNRRTYKLNGRTVYRRTLWLIGEQKIFRRSAPIEIVLCIRFWYSTPLSESSQLVERKALYFSVMQRFRWTLRHQKERTKRLDLIFDATNFIGGHSLAMVTNWSIVGSTNCFLTGSWLARNLSHYVNLFCMRRHHKLNIWNWRICITYSSRPISHKV